MVLIKSCNRKEYKTKGNRNKIIKTFIMKSKFEKSYKNLKTI